MTNSTRIAALGTLAALLVAGLGTAQEQMPTADAVLRELKAGNEHHQRHQYTHPHETLSRQHELVSDQHPHAMILGCADSRVPPEVVFDQGLGDLFTVRVAGNIVDDAVIGSFEYAVEHLHTPLLVVMGHQSCGAVSAAVEGGNIPGHLSALVTAIRPSVDKAKSESGNLIDNAVRVNVETAVNQLRGSGPVLSEAVAKGQLRIVGAVCSLENGEVHWLPN
jgi:carbonic anhydrase